jgi:hypothetical protein
MRDDRSAVTMKIATPRGPYFGEATNGGTMASEKGEAVFDRISSEALRDATGRDWDDWLETLDAAGAADWTHKEIVAYLGREHAEDTSSRWRQSITVGYDQARGLRVVGETADTGFQVEVQRTVAATVTEVWDVITSRPSCGWAKGPPSSSPRASGTRFPARAARSGSSSPATACG